MIVANELLRYWYKRLPFDARYDDAFDSLLGEGVTEVCEEFGDNAQANILTALYRAEQLKNTYAELGIGEDILDATLRDIVIWTNTWYGLKQEFGVMEVGWLEHHFSAKLFRLGRLQFCMGYHDFPDIPAANITKGDPIMEVHIPAGGSMKPEDCQASIAAARVFFAKYFPDFHYKAFTCHSWLLDGTLKQFLDDNSNILQFQALFTVAQNDPSDAMLKYIFRWDATREKIAEYEPQSKLAAAVKPYILDGGLVYESLGWFH